MITHTLSSAAILHHADMRDALKTLPDNSIDSVVCDPPYHLTSIVKRFGGENAAPAQFGTDGVFQRSSRGMMGKQWDGGDIAFQPETWREVLRVLKPGGYCVAFGAPRNFGRLQCAIYDAGFEERDTILNMIDPDDAVVQFLESLNETQLDAFMRCMAQSELSSAGFLAWTFGTGFPKSQNVAKFIDSELGAKGERGAPKLLPNGKEHHFNIGFGEGEGYESQAADRFGYVPATDEAREFDGFGTALKPAFEPIVLARKPLSEGTVAANVLRWRTGALNIAASRIHSAGSEAKAYTVKRLKPGATLNAEGGNWRPEGDDAEIYEGQTQAGRWPANVVHDGSDEVVGTFPQSVAGGQVRGTETSESTDNAYGKYNKRSTVRHADGTGSAARFFYSAKASKADRAGSKHPTIKPISLMEWLCTLITPPGGTVLDPFAGSGTTGIAATRKGFQVILCEREAEYVADIKRRFDARPGLVVDLAAVRREIELLPTLAALQARLRA